ncbi:MIP family channel protein [Colletotrichum graminicola]|uniref:MIP family channel protein n=1 Tax=Colletotrichum graminicola (strain M1.001 / M2 / FGSC 10212) TaxID=645133 RepID=E3QKX6_COLGM|nr:MIP family channel protein [Colletotrichum graminicola M1.001]EFQ31514.1 MIP family channel protein [Colletotrichum graminicola M1.001]WDK10259.1 MIP family channel protein [Colletotrichum graminicola]
MSGEQTGHLKAPEGEPSPVSPATAVDPHGYSDEENPVQSKFVSHSRQNSRGGSRSARRANTNTGRGGRDSVEEPLRTGNSTKSNRALRDGGRFGEYEEDSDTDRYWGPNDRHPDYSGGRAPRTRPPRAHLNRPQPYFNYDSHTDAKDYFEETRSYEPGDYGGRPPSRRMYDEELAGYPRSGIAVRSTNGDQARIDWHNLSREEKAQVMRLPLTQWMNSDLKNHFVASLGELVGTTMFLFFAFAGTEVANIKPAGSNGASAAMNAGTLLYISIIFGFSLMVNVWIFFRISGGLFNPAVTLGMYLVKAINAARAVYLFIAQLLGGMLASLIVRFLFPENFDVRTKLGGGATLVQGVFIEAILTAELVFTIFMLAKEKHRATFIAPVGIGLTLFIAELVGVQFTGGSLNPARSFGPCVITATFEHEHWIYWIGPFFGTLIAVVFYKFIKILEYEMANPGADGDAENDPTKNPAKMEELRLARTRSTKQG